MVNERVDADRQAVRELIENWVIWRDSGEWDRLATLWHPEGRMATTWCESTGAEFIARSKAAWEGGMTVIHSLGGTSIDMQGPRAIAQTRMQIIQRAAVHGVVVDVTCQGRFWDALEKIDGRWLLVLRQPIYELDRLAIVDPGGQVELDRNLLGSFPEGYRHLAYLQTCLGLKVRTDLPGTRGPALEALSVASRSWLQVERLLASDWLKSVGAE